MKLSINYENVRQRANEIRNTIQVLNVEKIKLQNILDELPTAWQGEAADVFKGKLHYLIDELKAAIKEMNNILQDILRVAKNIKDEDERLVKELSAVGRGGGGACGGR